MIYLNHYHNIMELCREFNIEKSQYIGKYLKDDDQKKRYKTTIFASDFHDLGADDFSVKVLYIGVAELPLPPEPSDF